MSTNRTRFKVGYAIARAATAPTGEPSPWGTSALPELFAHPGNRILIEKLRPDGELPPGLVVLHLSALCYTDYMTVATEGLGDEEHVDAGLRFLAHVADLRPTLRVFAPAARVEQAQLALRQAEVALWLDREASAGRAERAVEAFLTSLGLPDELAVGALLTALRIFERLGLARSADAIHARALLAGLVEEVPTDLGAADLAACLRGRWWGEPIRPR